MVGTPRSLATKTLENEKKQYHHVPISNIQNIYETGKTHNTVKEMKNLNIDLLLKPDDLTLNNAQSSTIFFTTLAKTAP